MQHIASLDILMRHISGNIKVLITDIQLKRVVWKQLGGVFVHNSNQLRIFIPVLTSYVLIRNKDQPIDLRNIMLRSILDHVVWLLAGEGVYNDPVCGVVYGSRFVLAFFDKNVPALRQAKCSIYCDIFFLFFDKPEIAQIELS